MLITKHAMGDSIKYKGVDCHESKLSEQAREGLHWATGNYTFPFEKRKFGTRSFCLSTVCHVESKIIEATKIIRIHCLPIISTIRVTESWNVIIAIQCMFNRFLGVTNAINLFYLKAGFHLSPMV